MGVIMDEFMELEILKLIYDYSVNGRLVDVKFADQLVNLVVSKKGLNSYVRGIEFTDKLPKNDYEVACAGYDVLNMKISVDYVSMQILMENQGYYDQLFNTFEQILFRNLTITQLLLHELEHACQNKQADCKNDNSIEAKLIKVSLTSVRALKNPRVLDALSKGEMSLKDFTNYILQNRKLYKLYYSLVPTERLANVYSFKTILNLLEPIRKSIPSLYEFEQASLFEAMLSGYSTFWSQDICPTHAYLQVSRRNNMLKEFDFYSEDAGQLLDNVSAKYTLARRLSLGLPVSKIEYCSAERWLQNTNKFCG